VAFHDVGCFGATATGWIFQCQKLYDKWDSIAIMDTVCVCILYIYIYTYVYNIYILGILTNKMNMSISSGFTCLVF